MNNPNSTSYRDISAIFGPAYINNNNKSVLNSSNASTMISGNESLLLSSIQKNKKAKTFQRKNIKLKNDIKNLKRITVENFSYRNLILQRALVNISKKEKNKVDLSNNKNEIIKGYFDKVKKDTINIDPKSSLTNRIMEQAYEKEFKKLSKFRRKLKTTILLKTFVHEQKKNYEDKLKEGEVNERLILDLNRKIENISFIIKELDNILTLYSYTNFLAERRRQVTYQNLREYTIIDYLKNDVNELFTNIKMEAEKLADLMNIRNLLICIREGVSIKDLPVNFTFFNDNYVATLDNVFKLIIKSNEKLKENEYINFEIPTNLLEYLYSKTIEKMKNFTVNKQFKNYLKLSFPIFKSVEEFEKYFNGVENKIKDHLIFILNENYEEYQPETNTEENENKKLINIKEQCQEKKIKLDNLKKENILLKRYHKKLLQENNLIKYNNKNSEKDNLKSMNKLLLESFIKSDSAQEIKFLYNFNRLKSKKNYEIKGAYIYYTLMKYILYIYKNYPEYIVKLHNFRLDEFKLRIKNFNVFIKSSSFKIIAEEILYLLSIYESTITNLMFDLDNLKRDPNYINAFNNISDEIFNNRRLEFTKFRVDLKEKVKNARYGKISDKQSKKILRKKCIYFPDIKLRRNNSQERIKVKTNNSRINGFKIDYSSINF